MIDQDHAMWLDSEVTRLSCALAKKERDLAEANRRIGYLLRVSGLGRVEAVDDAIRREAREVASG